MDGPQAGKKVDPFKRSGTGSRYGTRACRNGRGRAGTEEGVPERKRACRNGRGRAERKTGVPEGRRACWTEDGRAGTEDGRAGTEDGYDGGKDAQGAWKTGKAHGRMGKRWEGRQAKEMGASGYRGTGIQLP
ncbi:hypothetical protein L5D93_17595 [Paenibacillus thiaminolyticus]|nr:hypothetical protein [Paenibacillus thiaminolyticus]